MEEKVILGNGTELMAAAAVDDDGKLWIMIRSTEEKNNSVARLIQALGKKNAGKRIEYWIGEKLTRVFEGYGEVDICKMSYDGLCSARLRKA